MEVLVLPVNVCREVLYVDVDPLTPACDESNKQWAGCAGRYRTRYVVRIVMHISIFRSVVAS
jgi:hypothetical protein